MIIISISGVAGIAQIIIIACSKQSQIHRASILASGLFAFIVGLLVLPVDSFQILHMMNNHISASISPALVRVGLYTSLVPMFYGFFWFLISLIGWFYFKLNEITFGNRLPIINLFSAKH